MAQESMVNTIDELVNTNGINIEQVIASQQKVLSIVQKLNRDGEIKLP